MRALLCSLIVLFSFSDATALDSNRIIALEQDVRNLERLVATLEREVRELRRERSIGSPSSSNPRELQEPASDAWLNAANWRKVRVGTSEMEVIEILGRPTSMRVEGDARVLLYAMEIGVTGFLSGSVTLRDRQVAAVEMPALK
jgi:hypothetical protein